MDEREKVKYAVGKARCCDLDSECAYFLQWLAKGANKDYLPADACTKRAR